MKKFIKINYIVLIIFIIIFSNQRTLFADQEIDEELNHLQENKEQLENNIEQANKQIEVSEEELSGLMVKIEEISLEIIEKNQEVEKLTAENEILEVNVKKVQKELDELTENYNKNKEMLDQRLLEVYKSRNTVYWDLLFKSKGIIGFVSNYYFVSEMIKNDEKNITEIADTKEKKENIENELIEKKTKIENNKSIIQRNAIALENMQVLKEKRVSELSASEQELFKQIEDYQNEIAGIENEIRVLSLQNLGAKYIGGKMAWPVPGYTRITSPFGMRTHPITGIYKLHTGTDIGAPMGATFIAANDGVVLKAEYNSAYGNMVIIDHGGGVTTLYAHGSEILVQSGDAVFQGTPVLKVGSTGYSTGPHAHFEVRINGEFQNPMDYITSDSGSSENEKVIIN